MQYLRRTFLISLIGILMNPIMLFAVPHEPSPAGGDWLELNPKLGQTQTDAPWFPELTGELTIEAWIYVDEPLSKQVVFSLVGQTDRFNCFLIGTPTDEDEDGILDTQLGILSQGTTEHSGTMVGNLPARQWVHYVATIDRGAAVGSDGFIRERRVTSELPVPNRNHLVLGGIPVISGIPMMPGFKARFASGIYIDELRISSSIRYKGNYGIPTQAFTADAATIGLYHFDAESNQSYEDSSGSQIPLIRSAIDPEVLVEIEAATASPVLSKSEADLLQLIREGITYYDSLLESGRVDFLRETSSVAADGLPEMPRAPSGTWKGTFEFSGRKMRCVVTRDVIQYEPDRNIPIKGTEQYAYDGETFERLRETFNGMSLSRRSEIVDDPSDDPRFWGWNLSGQDQSLVILIDGLDVESIKAVPLNESDVYHIKGNMLDVAIELWLNPKKSYRPERYKVSNPMFSMTKDFKFKEVAPDLWFPESAKGVNSVTDMKTGTKTDESTTTVQFTNIRINEPIPESRFSIEPPPGASVFDMRTRESFEVPEENNK
ncbi:hypothetical protein F4054_05175 [Candidatus Poribacteria bacterium]|nr:hypothetical protein [Candidatus Poribacteria bacterium]MYG08901.1 hypothetical protein [Candidatus Poribacteria bacterium]MYK21637.1 hypothetical protein [Candidatus Poribacteria bacterium]